MKEKEENTSVVKHFYNLPKSEAPVTENYRQLTIVTLNETITLASSFKEENLLFLANLGLDLLCKIQEKK